MSSVGSYERARSWRSAVILGWFAHTWGSVSPALLGIFAGQELLRAVLTVSHADATSTLTASHALPRRARRSSSAA